MAVNSKSTALSDTRLADHPRVLLIEDVDATRRRMADVLRMQGYDVVEASDGREALQRVSDGPFDAILLDLILPHVDGWQFRASLLRDPELATIPTVVVSVRPLRDVDRYLLRVKTTMVKPFEDGDLLDTVRGACAESPRRVARHDAPHAADVGLYWSRRGEVACAQHAPCRGSAEWLGQGWTAIPERKGHRQIMYQCEHCPGRRGPIRRRDKAGS